MYFRLVMKLECSVIFNWKRINCVLTINVITCLSEYLPQYRLLKAKPPVTYCPTDTLFLELSSSVGRFQLVFVW